MTKHIQFVGNHVNKYTVIQSKTFNKEYNEQDLRVQKTRLIGEDDI